MPNIFADPRMDMPFIRTWDSREEHCAKVAIRRNNEIKRLKAELERVQSHDSAAMRLIDKLQFDIEVNHGVVSGYEDEIETLKANT